MDIQPADPPLPDVPLMGPILAWMEEEEDPPRSMEERRAHVRAFIRECPSVYRTYQDDASISPHVEVRSALRELGGLQPDDTAHDLPAERHHIHPCFPGP